ncbi:rhomboid family intramembrane serine protease [Candidatus Uabimicrobium amorphum]|uniref:Rhomboid family intramembrane serine protease GlpG n=1 Tax=Uabimicrobium amorphum TaxID=2596890 RepID=A0A5S9F1Z9_UABAM|nr:rhomboid family intramembrane serine protease [Candidatus Uabimicrobium amorphum]BBM82958.1 rhomboid family intramembrane serine protease GlpG [Candidatus Uabimicrobium amorphum]
MRKIGKLQNQKDAQTLSNYLISQDIENVIKNSQDEYVIWVHDEDKLETAKNICNEFTQNPDDGKYANVIVKKPAKKKRAKKVTLVLGPQYPFLTQLFIVVCIIVTGLFHSPALREIIAPHVLILHNPFLSHHWTIITPIFVHFDLLHLVFNMLALNFLGSLIEGKHGSIFYLTQIVVIATISNMAEFMISPSIFGGMSGVLYGQFGYLWIRDRLDKTWDIHLGENVVKLAIVWFFLCWFVIPGIANYAHSAGLLCGMLWGYLAARES